MNEIIMDIERSIRKAIAATAIYAAGVVSGIGITTATAIALSIKDDIAKRKRPYLNEDQMKKD